MATYYSPGVYIEEISEISTIGCCGGYRRSRFYRLHQQGSR